MPRPVKPRRVEGVPRVNFYKPAGVPMASLEEVVLNIDEYEALRLKDMEKLEQFDCAAKMGVAQSTFQRIITAARHKMVSALVEGKALRIEGGQVDIAGHKICGSCQHLWPECDADHNQKVGRNRKRHGQETNPAPETGANCPQCGNEV